MPGSAFGRPESELSTRIAYVDFDGCQALADAAHDPDGVIDDTFLRAHCPRVMAGIERIADWLGG